MLEQVKIVNYRGIEEVELPNLGRVNLVVGPNGSSKTALLESLHMLCLDGNSEALLHLAKPEEEQSDNDAVRRAFEWLRRRSGADVGRSGPTVEGHWNAKYRSAELRFDVPGSRPIETYYEASNGGANAVERQRLMAKGAEFDGIVAQASFVASLYTTQEGAEDRLARVALVPGGQQGRIVGLQDPRPVAIKCILMHGQVHSDSALDHLPEFISAAEAGGTLESVVQFLQRFDPRVRALRIGIGARRRPVARVLLDELGLTPVAALGSGLVATAAMLLALRSQDADVALMDEFDSSLHVGIIQELLPRMLEIARTNKIQIFASTHRSDTLACLAHLGDELLQDIRIIQTSRIRQRLTAKVISGESATRLTSELGLDLRQPT